MKCLKNSLRFEMTDELTRGDSQSINLLIEQLINYYVSPFKKAVMGEAGTWKSAVRYLGPSCDSNFESMGEERKRHRLFGRWEIGTLTLFSDVDPPSPSTSLPKAYNGEASLHTSMYFYLIFLHISHIISYLSYHN